MSGPHVITLLSDFGDRDAYAGVMKGVILSRDPGARIVDLTHGVPPQDVYAGAYLLESAHRWFPSGTVHVAVVDPGVGTDRAILVVQTSSGIYLAPDNGLLTPVLEEGGVRQCIALETVPEGTGVLSATFHGRDLFAPAAAFLARGGSPADLGPSTQATVSLLDYRPRIDGGAAIGRVLHIDRFGNAISSIRVRDLSGGASTYVVDMEGHGPIPIRRTYADVAPGQPISLPGSSDHLEVSVRDGSAAESLGITPGARIAVRPRR